jgi:hypothetical protein
MPIIENNTVSPTGNDGFVKVNQAYHMIRKYSDALRYIQFDICEVKKVYSVGKGTDAGLYGAIQGRLVTSEKNTTLKNRWIKPFSLRDLDLPSENEYVMVFEYGVPPEATELYYIRDWSANRSLNYNIFTMGLSGNATTTEMERAASVINNKVTKDVPLPRYKDGDKFINGRFGQTIQFTSKNDTQPCLRITNNTNKFGEDGVFTPYFDNEGSVIYLEGSQIPLDLKERVSGVDTFPELTGDQVVIESDRLILQSKKEEVFINGFKKVSINSPEILINGQPYVHGNFIKDLVDQLVSIFDKMQKKLLVTAGGPVEASAILPEISILKSIQRQIFNSKYKNETNPKGESPKQKTDAEMEAYLATSGYTADSPGGGMRQVKTKTIDSEGNEVTVWEEKPIRAEDQNEIKLPLNRQAETREFIDFARSDVHYTMPHDPENGVFGLPYTYVERLRGDGPYGLETELPCNREVQIQRDPICPKGYKPVGFSEVFNSELYYSSAPGWYFKDEDDPELLTVIITHTQATDSQIHDHLITLECMPDDGIPSSPAPHPTADEYTLDLERAKAVERAQEIKKSTGD